jgi:Fe-S cluster biogenesis protein NfuA
MSGEAHDLRDRLRQLEGRIEELERCPDPIVRATAREVVQTLLDFHSTGLARLLDLVTQMGEPGQGVLAAAAQDGLVGPLLLLYGLHPHDLALRVGQALDRVRPQLHDHGADAELLTAADGFVRVQVRENGGGTLRTFLRSLVEETVADAAPDAKIVSVEDARQNSGDAACGLISLPLVSETP